eukprot:s1441_g6.t1
MKSFNIFYTLVHVSGVIFEFQLLNIQPCFPGWPSLPGSHCQRSYGHIHTRTSRSSKQKSNHWICEVPPLAAWMIRTGPLQVAATGCTYHAPSELTSLLKDGNWVVVCQEKILKDIQENEGYDKLNGRYRSLLQLTLNFYSSAMSQVAALSAQIQEAVKGKDSEREDRGPSSVSAEAQLLQLRRFELRRLEEAHGAEQRCAMLQARCRSLEQDIRSQILRRISSDPRIPKADALMPASQANALGLAAAASVNFMMQRRSFAPGAVLNSSLLKRYVLAEALIVSIQQVFFLTLLETRPFLAHLGNVSQENPWLLGGLRMASQAMVFVAVSFPLRKYWVFAAYELPLYTHRTRCQQTKVR